MHTYEKMLIDASNNGFEIVEKNFKSDAKGLCKGKKIGIRKDMSDTEKACVLADYLDCSVDYLLGRTDNPEINK